MPSDHERNILNNLDSAGDAVADTLKKITGDDCNFICMYASREKKNRVALGGFAANVSPTSIVFSFMELIYRWEAQGTIAPIGELRDGSGRSLADILNEIRQTESSDNKTAH